MARSIQEIYDAIVAEKETQSALGGLLPASTSHADLLAQLTSGSKVAVWRLWAHTTAVGIHVHEALWDIFRAEAQALADAAPAGTTQWYRDRMLEFQFGDQLEYIDARYRYAAIDEAKRIVELCAVSERLDGLVLVKAAKLVNDEPAPLDASEKTALDAYAQLLKFAGVRLTVISEPADEVQLDYDIHYDAQIPLATVKADVAAAVDAYLEALPFDGVVSITRLTDAIQAVTGVRDVVYRSGQGREIGGPFVTIDRVYNPTAGYVTLFEPIEDSFTWIPA